MRAYTWTKYLADLLSEHIPSCCLNFKRRKLYPEKSKYIIKIWMYCSISGCRLDNTALLRKDKFLEINNRKPLVSHSKGDRKSFQSRFVRGDDRMALGKSASESTYPSKEFHRRLAELDEKSFQAGNLKDTPISKNVVRQCAYAYRKSTLEDKDIIKSIQLLQQKYVAESKSKCAKGLIQFFSVTPFTVALVPCHV